MAKPKTPKAGSDLQKNVKAFLPGKKKITKAGSELVKTVK
jgi:hypothetical protein